MSKSEKNKAAHAEARVKFLAAAKLKAAARTERNKARHAAKRMAA